MRKNWILILSLTLIIFFTHAFGQGGLDQRISELSQQIAKEMTEYNKTTIAVIEFSDLQGNVTDFGRFLAEELITRLYQTKKFKVIERHLLNKIIAEQKLSLTGIVDPTSAKQLGKILSVDAIVSGSITDLAQSLRINARLISTETGEIFAVASTEIFKDESVMKLLQTGVKSPTSDKKTASSQTTTEKKILRKVDAKNFTFELKNVQMTSTTVIIDLLITNNDKDRILGLGIFSKWRNLPLFDWSSTRIFDDAGNEYHVNYVQLANKSSSGYTESLLVSGVPTKAQLKFENVSIVAQSISLLEIWCYLGEGNVFNVQFRDIPIEKIEK
jgi:TolB-like protein